MPRPPAFFFRAPPGPPGVGFARFDASAAADFCEDALFAESARLAWPDMAARASGFVPRDAGAVFPVAFATVDCAPAVRLDALPDVFWTGALVVRRVVDLAADPSPIALRAVDAPPVDLRADDDVAAGVRCAAADLPVVEVVLAFLGADATLFLPMLFRAVPADFAAGRAVPVFFVAALRGAAFAGDLPTAFLAADFFAADFFAGALLAADLVGGFLLAADFLLAFFAADLDAFLVAPVLLVDLRGLLVAMRVSRRMKRRRTAACIR